MTARPLLLLDVDGVLNPFAPPSCPPGYQEHDFFPGEEPVRLCRQHGAWLHELAARFEIAWGSAWGAQANRLIAPLLGLPPYPFVEFPPPPFPPAGKVPAIARFAGDRPAVWIDDLLTDDAYAWAAGREAPPLLIGVDPGEGLVRPMIDQCLSWAAEQVR